MTIRPAKLIWKKKFVKTALDSEDKTFVVYVASISQNSNVYSFYKTQIAFWKADKALTFVLFKYADFTNVFFENLIAKLPEYTEINNYVIDLIKD